MARNPWKKLMSNINLSAVYGSAGGRSETNPKFSGRAWAQNAANSSQSTSRHEITVDWEYLRDQFNRQEKLCYWFGIPLNPQDVFISYYPLALSVDRLDNTFGYIPGNIVICCRLANLGRGVCDPETYKKVIETINFPYNKKVYKFFTFNTTGSHAT